MEKYLMRKNVILDSGIKESGNETNIIPFDNMLLQLGNSDPSNVIIPSLEEVIRINAEIAETQFDVKYTYEVNQSTLPTPDELNALYDGTGIPAKNFDGTDALLGRTVGTQVFNGDGISVVALTSGIFEVAGFQGDKWLISNLKNNIPSQIADLTVKIDKNISDITYLDNKIIALTAESLTISNAKDITGHGVINYTDATAVEPSKIPTREEVASSIRGLKQEIDESNGAIVTAGELSDEAKAIADEAKAQVDLNTPAIASNVTNINDNKVEADATRDQVALNTPQIETNRKDIATNVTNIQSNATAIVTLKGDDASHDGRIQALEDAEDLDDKVWTGSIDGAATIDLSALVDENGDKFNFDAGDKIELVFEHTGDAVEEGRDIVVGVPNATSYTIGTVGFTAKLANTGTVTLVKKTGGQGTISDFKLIRIVEAKKVKAISTSYSKSESDGKYTLKTTTAALDTRVATNLASIGTVSTDVNTNKTDVATNKTAIAKNVTDIAANKATGVTNASATTALTTKVTANTAKGTANATAITAKQDNTDTSLTTSTKSVVGAINEINTAYKTADTVITTAYKAADTATLTAAKTYTDAHTPATKTVTIPAGYGWKTVTSSELNNDSNIGKKIKVTSYSSFYLGILGKGHSDDYSAIFSIYDGDSAHVTFAYYNSANSGKLGIAYLTKDSTNIDHNFIQYTKIEVWDIITPAQTVKVLA